MGLHPRSIKIHNNSPASLFVFGTWSPYMQFETWVIAGVHFTFCEAGFAEMLAALTTYSNCLV
jgi:hypothetical protein